MAEQISANITQQQEKNTKFVKLITKTMKHIK